MKYYYLIASLPNLNPDKPPRNLDFKKWHNFILRNLAESDRHILELLTVPERVKKLVQILHEKRKEPQVYPLVIEVPDLPVEFKKTNDLITLLPPFLSDWLTENDYWLEEKPISDLERQLFSLFYHEISNSDNDFIKSYFRFLQDLKNIIAAINARTYDLPIKNQLIGESDINSSLTRSQTPDFGLGEQYPFIEQLQQYIDKSSLYDLEKYVNRLKWNRLEELTSLDFFENSNVFAYYLQLKISWRWLLLDQQEAEKGQIEHLLSDAMNKWSIKTLNE
jgi:hypothetical protein